MPKLRRLSGLDVIHILEQFGFRVVRIRGSHHILRRTVGDDIQTVNVPVHGSKQIGPGLLKRIYRGAGRYIPEEDLRSHFYSE